MKLEKDSVKLEMVVDDVNGFDYYRSIYWKEAAEHKDYYGLHHDGFQSWVNAYDDTGKFLYSAFRCFDHKGLFDQLINDPNVIFVTHEADEST